MARGLVAVTIVAILASCSTAPASDAPWVGRDGTLVGNGVLWSMQGPDDHCEWGSATFLFIGRQSDPPGVGAEWRGQYVRDPEGLFDGISGFDPDATLQTDAASAGFSTDTAELWLSASTPNAVFVKISEEFERWPRVVGDPIFCA